MAKYYITTTISQENWELCKKNGWAWNDIVREGIKAKLNNPEMNLRMKELEEGNIRLQRKLSQLFGEIEELRHK